MPSLIPSFEEMRRVYWLLGECTELGADPILWRQHLAEGCSVLINNHFVNVVDASVTPGPDGQPRPMTLGYSNGGELINKRLELISRFMQAPEKINPMVPAMLTSPATSSTHLRRELVPDQEWYRSHFFQDYLRPLGLNDQVTSVELSSAGAISAICWLSYPGEKCSERAARLLRFLHAELTRLNDAGKLAPMGGFSLFDLSPRQREVLYGIFQGDSEKQLALRLGISQHTVHDYLKRLHRRLGVRSRRELIHRCLDYWPALKHLQAR